MQWYAHEWVHAETFVEARAVGEERGQSRLKEHTEYHLIVAVHRHTQTRRYHLAVLLTHCGQLILRKKISKSDATRCQVLRLKSSKFNFLWGSELTALPQTP